MTSNLDTTKRQLHELRFDRAGAGGIAAHLDWYRTAAAKGGLFAEHKVPSPSNIWSVSLGSVSPALVSLYKWDSLTQREATLGKALATDEATALLRAANGKGPVLLGSESWLLIDSPAADGVAVTGQVRNRGIHEMRVQRPLNGSLPRACQSLVEFEVPQAVARGAQFLGMYELAIGPDRPIIVWFLAWPEGMSPHTAWSEIDSTDELASRRLDERAQLRRRLFSVTEQYLLDAMDLSAFSAHGQG